MEVWEILFTNYFFFFFFFFYFQFIIFIFFKGGDNNQRQKSLHPGLFVIDFYTAMLVK